MIRYNWIEGGNRALDLVDDDGGGVTQFPEYSKTHVYGNVLIELNDGLNSQVAHYGGDSGNTNEYRKGTLYFYNNTVISYRTGNTTLVRLSTNDETADVRNNIVYVTASGNKLALIDGAGVFNYRNNPFKTGYVNSHSGVTGTVSNQGGNITGTAPDLWMNLRKTFILTITRLASIRERHWPTRLRMLSLNTLSISKAKHVLQTAHSIWAHSNFQAQSP